MMDSVRRLGLLRHMIYGVIMTSIAIAESCGNASAQEPDTGALTELNLITNLPQSVYAGSFSGESIKKPNVPNDLLNNIQYVIKYGLLVRTDFYTAKNLRVFFGGNDVSVTYDGPDQKTIEIKQMNNLFQTSKEYWGQGVYIRCVLMPGAQMKQIIGKALFSIGIGSDNRLTRETIITQFPENGEDPIIYGAVRLTIPVTVSKKPNRYLGSDVIYNYYDKESRIDSHLEFQYYSDNKVISLGLGQEIK
jgi:hypothetical protein